MIHDTLQVNNESTPLVSVIMPVYNTQDYVSISIQSILNQTYQNFEIICIDDGSTDRSAEIIRKFMCEDPRIKLIRIENHGQGYARNLALKEAKGEYIMFMDADDFIEDVTFDLAVTRAECDGADVVLFDWRYFEPIGQTDKYINHNAFFNKLTLEGEECRRLLEISPIFTVNKLYRKKFLDDNNVYYGEGHIYEDNPFWIKVALCASKVSLIHSPLYRVTISYTSSTKTNYDTSFHYESYIKAVTACINILKIYKEKLNGRIKYTLLCYFIERFMFYYTNRTPRKYKKRFLREFVNLLSELDFEDMHERKMLSFFLKNDVFKNKKYGLFSFGVNYQQKIKPAFLHILQVMKNTVKKAYNKLLKWKNKIFRTNSKQKSSEEKIRIYSNQAVYNDVILFMGFDHRYVGNSRYLFEEVLKNKPNRCKVFFVTDDPLVPLQYRLEPNSDRAHRFIGRSKVVIFESWIPLKYFKNHNSVWIQLWHGTPLKKMLFDSNEKEIITNSPNQKINKYTDVQRWDYLNLDNPNIESFFRTSFLLPPSKMTKFGYPRVKYLLDKKDDLNYKNKLKEFYGIPTDKKIVLYLPTWRDYNYRATDEKFDLDYLLDLKELKQKLGEEYHIIYKDHTYLSKSENVDFKNYNNVETQELLLLADCLISDYSSAIFDGFALDIPVVLYCNDFERNCASRGVYEEMWNDISCYSRETIDELVPLIQNYKLDEQYHKVKDKYSYKNACDKSFSDFVLGFIR